MILSLEGWTKSYGEKRLFTDVNLAVSEGDKIGIVGVNGTGKSTLLKIIIGELPADEGEVTLKKDATFGYLAQYQEDSFGTNILDTVLNAREDLLSMEKRLSEMEQAMSDIAPSEMSSFMDNYHKLQHQFDLQGGYTFRSEAIGILKGLGFEGDDLQKSMNELSGGQKTRVSLGRLLASSPDLLLLDEPINHLDLNSIVWLEGYLASYKGSVIIVAHDRYFLDKIVDHVVDLSYGKTNVYNGNYTAYVEQKAVYQLTYERSYEKQQKEIKHQKEVIDTLRSFNREKSVKRADSRQHVLDKMELIEKPVEEKIDMGLEFHLNKDSGNDVLSVKNISKSYGERTLFSDVSFEIKKGEHVALIGANGTGKTNILKIINGVIPADSGEILLGSNVEIGYFDQQSAVLSDEKTVFEEISDTYPKMTETEIRNTMASFLFRGDEVFTRISILSGGERGRVVLAKLMLSGANFLILDEPTNHLDMISKEILENALNAYPGTLFYVSHDRYFINRTAERILCLDNNCITGYLGDYDYYLEKSTELQAGIVSSADKIAGNIHSVNNQSVNSVNANISTGTANSNAAYSAGSVSESKADWQKAKAEQAAKRKLENQIKKIEEEISVLETALSDLEIQMNNPDIATNSVKLQEVCKEHSEKKELLDEKMALWEELLLSEES